MKISGGNGFGAIVVREISYYLGEVGDGGSLQLSCVVGFVMFKDLSIFVASCIGFHTVQILVDFGGVVGVGGCSSFWHGDGEIELSQQGGCSSPAVPVLLFQVLEFKLF